MILLESAQILAAVRRGLEAHVLPDVTNEFARLQVLSAMKALDEVHHRITEGDPCVESNRRLEAELAGLAESLHDTDAPACDALTTALTGLPDTAEPRERTRLLGERLTTLLGELTPPSRARVLGVLQAHALATVGEDSVWMCSEAIASLQ